MGNKGYIGRSMLTHHDVRQVPFTTTAPTRTTISTTPATPAEMTGEIAWGSDRPPVSAPDRAWQAGTKDRGDCPVPRGWGRRPSGAGVDCGKDL